MVVSKTVVQLRGSVIAFERLALLSMMSWNADICLTEILAFEQQGCTI